MELRNRKVFVCNQGEIAIFFLINLMKTGIGRPKYCNSISLHVVFAVVLEQLLLYVLL